MTADPSRNDLRRLRSHFQYSHTPFSKFAWASQMFDSAAQKDLLHGLLLWLELKGIALVTGQSGAGKSITLRRFGQTLDQARYRVIDFSYLPSTPNGFLRSLSRKLGLPPRAHTTDLFDQIQRELVGEGDDRAHPVLIIDDAEGLSASVVDVIRRLTVHQLDAEDRFSVVLAGTEGLLSVLRETSLQPLVTRIVYAAQLKSFGLDDTRSYVRYHLERADISPKLFSEDAVRKIFGASHGKPRTINQLAVQSMIQAAVVGRDSIDAAFVDGVIAAHPLLSASPGR